VTSVGDTPLNDLSMTLCQTKTQLWSGFNQASLLWSKLSNSLLFVQCGLCFLQIAAAWLVYMSFGWDYFH